MADENDSRVYGMADGNDRAAPAAQGMRGEQTSLAPEAEDKPALSRRVTLDTGAVVRVTEESGVGWAEAVGRAGLVRNEPHLAPAEDRGAQGPPADPKAMPRQHSGPLARAPRGGALLLALAAVAGIGLAVRYRRRISAGA